MMSYTKEVLGKLQEELDYLLGEFKEFFDQPVNNYRLLIIPTIWTAMPVQFASDEVSRTILPHLGKMSPGMTSLEQTALVPTVSAGLF